MNLKVEANKARYYLEGVFKSVAYYFYKPTWLIQMPWEPDGIHRAPCDDKFPADSVAHYYAMAVYMLRHGSSDKELVQWAKKVFTHYPPKNDDKILLTPKMGKLFTDLVESKQMDDFLDEGEIHGPQTSRRTLAKTQVDEVENVTNEMDYKDLAQYLDDYYKVYEAIQKNIPQKGSEAKYADFLLQTIHPAELNKSIKENSADAVAKELKIADPLYLEFCGDGNQDKLKTKLGEDGSKPVHLFVREKPARRQQPLLTIWHLHIRRK